MKLLDHDLENYSSRPIEPRLGNKFIYRYVCKKCKAYIDIFDDNTVSYSYNVSPSNEKIYHYINRDKIKSCKEICNEQNMQEALE